MRGFLWCQGDIRRGKAKVAWEVVCLPKKEGGLWLRHLDIFNKALMVSHIWSLLLLKESLWCPISPLLKIILAHDIHKAGFDMSNMIKDLFNNGQWTWPHDWISKYPALATIVVPNIVYNDVDELEWRNSSWTPMDFFCRRFGNVFVLENHIKIYAGTPRVAASLNAIIDHIIPMSKKKTTRSMIAKLVFAASTYII
ncbi:hypothetical protein Tco_1364227 [Tanacetum coccineum]